MSLAQGNNTLTRPRIEPGSPDLESDALTTKPVRSLILERFREGSVESVYNFPVDNTVTVEQLIGFVNQVYERQSKAFKSNLNFGYLLRHRDDGSSHYFKPFEHEGVLDIPVYIASRRDLIRLEDWLRNLNLLGVLMMQRPDTKWVIELLTSVRFTVYKTNFCSETCGFPYQSTSEETSLYTLW